MKNTVHLIGNAHIDPVWLWRFGDGLAEIKASFRSALDRIGENDEFIFTSACAFYYKWVEENCPEMFDEIRAAVNAGRWSIVGGMWVQPDLNIPSAEALARHLLYSQRYFVEKFGKRATCGYNVDSFGHTAALSKILNAAGIDKYIFMRPSSGAEMSYPFTDDMFVWKCGDSAVKTFRITDPYCRNLRDDTYLKQLDERVSSAPHDTMLFYGVGNHGGGPTVTNLRIIDAFKKDSANVFEYSSPDRALDSVDPALLPVYEGELQNHASGCYSANSAIKSLNRQCENRLSEAERLEVMAGELTGFKAEPAKTAEAWESVMFNQFHDIMCGCATKASYDDAYAFGGAAKAHALKLTNAAAQKISWAVDTSKGNAPRTKESHGMVWEANNLGTPVVVFNPLSHPAIVPTHVHLGSCTAVTDEHDHRLEHQIIRSDYTNGGSDKTFVYFRPEIPALGYKTFWVYREKEFAPLESICTLKAEGNRITNGIITLTIDKNTGSASIETADGVRRLAGTKTILVDDSANDTWAHNRFVFDRQLGQFSSTEMHVTECGVLRASIKVTQRYGTSRLVQTYTLFKGSDAVRVNVKLFLDEPLVMVKHCFELAGSDKVKAPTFTREIPGGMLSRQSLGLETDGRELPMQKWMALHVDGCGIAVTNDCKYSSSAAGNEMRMIGARSCYFADHYGARDEHMELADMGEQEYSYEIRLFDGDFAALSHAAEELGTAFPIITETYHEGKLAQEYSAISLDRANITATAIKPAEDGNGIILRLFEIAGIGCVCKGKLLGTDFECSFKPGEIKTLRFSQGRVTECDLCEYQAR